MPDRWIERIRGANLRDRIFFLLLAAVLFGFSTSVVSILALGRTTRAGQEAVRTELAASQALGAVAAERLGQGRAVERALRFAQGGAPPPEGSPYWAARDRFEEHASEVWSGFQRVKSLVVSESDRVAEVDRAHNEYAAGARRVFAAIDQGDLGVARRQARALEAEELRLEAALGAILEDAEQASEATLGRLDAERRSAIGLVSILTILALLGGLAVLVRTVHLVSTLHSLEGLLPICAQCKAIRDDQGYWTQLESFVEANSGARFTHGLCEGCVSNMKAQIQRTRAETPSEALV